MTISTDSSSPGGELQVEFVVYVDLKRVEGNPQSIALPKTEPPAVVKKDDPVDRTPKGVLFTKPGKSEKPTSYMKVVSPQGDYIGQGKNYDYTGDQLVVKPSPRGLTISVDGWRLDIGAPKDQTLKVGEYIGAKRFAFSGESPGLDFSGKGRGSNMLTGEFVVWELEIKDDKIVKVAIDFTQRSEGKPLPLKGKIRINSAFE